MNWQADVYKTLAGDKDIGQDVVDENEKLEFISTGVVNLNIAYSGKVFGGIPMGKVSQMASLSSLGKSFVGMSIGKNAQKKDCFFLYIDTENAFDYKFAKQCGVDTSKEKFMALSNNNIFDVQKAILKSVKNVPKDKRKYVFIFLDSFANLQTPQTLKKAEEGNEKKDMSITQLKNGLSRVLSNTHATIFVANHLYQNVGGFGDALQVPGGKVLKHNCTGVVMGSSKAKDKDSQENITGSIITIEIEKSRLAYEKAKLKFRIKRDGGLDIYYGLLDDAKEHGCVEKTGNYYIRPHIKNDKKFYEKNIYNKEFWLPIFRDTDFKDFLETKYAFKEENKLDIADDDDLSETANEKTGKKGEVKK